MVVSHSMQRYFLPPISPICEARASLQNSSLLVLIFVGTSTPAHPKRVSRSVQCTSYTQQLTIYSTSFSTQAGAGVLQVLLPLNNSSSIRRRRARRRGRHHGGSSPGTRCRGILPHGSESQALQLFHVTSRSSFSGALSDLCLCVCGYCA